MVANLFLKLIEFHFFDIPKKIIHAWKNYLWFCLYFFSLKNIILTFFSPWKRIAWAYPRGFSFGAIFEVFIGNLFSRILGAIVRSVFIVLCLVFEFLIFIIGIFILLFWILLPFFLFFLFLRPSFLFLITDFLKRYFW